MECKEGSGIFKTTSPPQLKTVKESNIMTRIKRQFAIFIVWLFPVINSHTRPSYGYRNPCDQLEQIKVLPYRDWMVNNT